MALLPVLLNLAVCHINSFVLSLKLFLFAFICYGKQSNFGSFIDQTFTPNGKLHFILEVSKIENNISHNVRIVADT